MGFQVPLAVKILNPTHADQEPARRRFLSEARVLALLRHPNLISVVDAGEYEQRPYYIMELVEGTTLAAIMERQGRLLPIDASLFITARIAAACHCAHVAVDDRDNPLRIVHRDVNPSNVLIGRNGVIKLIDFGIATSTLGPRETRVNVVKGNPRYMSPEQAFGLDIDLRSDIYTLALTLYHGLTGRNPLDVRTQKEALAVARQPKFQPPSQYRPAVSGYLDRVLMRALGRDPKARYPSMDAFGRALQGCLVETNPSMLPESLDLLLQNVDIPPLIPPDDAGTKVVHAPTKGSDDTDEVLDDTGVYTRPDSAPHTAVKA